MSEKKLSSPADIGDFIGWFLDRIETLLWWVVGLGVTVIALIGVIAYLLVTR